jgi:hypothetical protein
MKVIITGSTGMAGEGVLLECLQNENVSSVLSISRKPCGIEHARLKELIVPDFMKLQEFETEVNGYDACFYCAGISSVGMKETRYHHITYDTTIAFASVLSKVNPNMVFCYITGSGTDSTERGRIMWARVKGKTENALMKMSFAKAYNFRPAAMLPVADQKNVIKLYVVIAKLIKFFAPSGVLTLQELGKAMIHAVTRRPSKQILEVKDIRSLSK